MPAALLDAGLARDKQVVVLEPRRIAARAAAEFVARERGEKPGASVGYRVRFEHCGGVATRLWFVTDGVFGRQLARDPFLDDVGVLVLDEFHERHLQGDIALAVARELQATVRPDLLLVVMSATVETRSISRFLEDCPVLDSPGRAFPVEIEYESAKDDRPLAGRVASALRRVLKASPAASARRGEGEEGDILVFLPGAAEILRAREAIEPLAREHGLDVVPLHGDLPLDAQARAIQRGPRRKVVLSTNVAETALTIEGVTTVIDSGLARIASFDPRHGINKLRLQPISRAATDQRAGRAGRLAPGRCLRLWTEAEQLQRRPHETPEILRLDLSAIVLELRAWGLRDLAALRWLDPPRESSLRSAEALLELLGAVEAGSGRLTPTGRRMLAMPVAPRLARLLIEAERQGRSEQGALLAALASERDILLERRGLGPRPDARHDTGACDLTLRADLFEEAEQARFDRWTCARLGLDVRTVRAVDRARRQLKRATGDETAPSRGSGLPGLLLLCAFPDRVCRRRTPGSPRALMVGGTGVVLDETSVVRDAELFVAVELERGSGGDRAEARVRLASAVEPAWLNEFFPASIHETADLVFDVDRRRVVRRARRRYVDLVLEERISLDVDPLESGPVLAAALCADAACMTRVRGELDGVLARLRFLRMNFPEAGLPEPETMLRQTIDAACAGQATLAEVQRADLAAILFGLLAPPHRQLLDREAPAHLRLPSGRNASIVYDVEQGPTVAARIQELFGLAATPRLAGGRVPLTLELLAPSQRPVQITRDLASFWRNTYPEVRKQLRGRYPKHDWPEDPLEARPTSRVRRR